MNDRTDKPHDPGVEHERDLYLRLLELGREVEVEPFLDDALGLVVDAVHATHGYLEIYGERSDDEENRWWIARGFEESEVENLRASISRGIIGEAVATGQTIVTSSALTDPRFEARASVRGARIEAVLCSPIGQAPPCGVLYLQGRSAPGEFSADDRALVEVCARHLAPLIDRLLAQHAEADDATAEIRSRLRLDSIIGRGAAMARVLREIGQIVSLDVSVLLTGESGTGKSQLARVIHDNGPRAGEAFVEVNCAALQDTLVESELFGAMPGAHSTATKRVYGKVAAAERGTLFLDEVGELTPAAQAKLLQLLQSRQYSPLGATKVETADVRVVAATNADLRARVSEGRFREDLLYRLDVLPVRMPSLAERREDIAELARFFCERACTRHGLAALDLSRDMLRAIEAAEWPGNVRQLEHAVEAAAIRASGERAGQVERGHVFPDEVAADSAASGSDDAAATFQEATRRYQAGLLRSTLADTDWNVAEAARRLDLTRSHVYNLIRAFGLKRDSS